MSLRPGFELLTSYQGPPNSERALTENQADPRSLAAADFDEDGVPDLVGGYAYQDRGIIAVHRGNVDSIYPNAPEALLRRKNGTFTDAPFLSPAKVFEAPVAADFLGAGDFDADGHWDLVLAKRGGTTLHFVLGDGTGSFTAERDVTLDGLITAFTTGEINRQDGLTDIVVAIDDPQGSRALVFEGPEGALKSSPESFGLPAAASSLALGQFGGDYTFDLALAVGNEVLIFEGRDRRLSLDAQQQAEVQPARISARDFEFQIRSLVGGNFSGDSREDLALLSDDGRVHLVTQTAVRLKGKTSTRPLNKWPLESLQNDLTSATTLVRARISTSPWDSLLALDEVGRKINTIARFPAAGPGSASALNTIGPTASEMNSLDVGSEPRAVLAMRMDIDAFSDLVVMKSGSSAPSIVQTAPQNVTTTFASLTPGPSAAGVFGNPAPIAINGANSQPVGGTPYPSTITVSGFAGSLDKVRVRLNNVTKSFANDTHFLVVSPTGQKVLVLSGYFAHLNGVDLTFDDNAAAPITAPACCVASGSYKPTVVEPPPGALPSPAPAGPYSKTLAPFVGTDPNGIWSLYISNSDGFTGSVAGGWQLILNDPAPANFVVVNTNDSGAGSLRQAIVDANQKVGADFITFNIPPSGAHTIVPASALPDVTDPVTIDATTQPGFSGVPLIEIDGSNTGGFAGTFRGVLNMEAGSSVIRGLVINRYNTDAIALLTFGNNIVEGNFIGTDLTGTLDRGNQLTDGITLDSPNNLIGGTTAAARNLISGIAEGVVLAGPGPNLVQGNFIGTNLTGDAQVPNSHSGVTTRSAPGSPNNVVGGTTAGARNIISAGISATGVDIVYAASNGALVQGNYIGTDVTGTKPFGPFAGTFTGNNDGIDITGGAHDVTIGGTTPAARNIISGNFIGLEVVDDNTVSNLIQGNFVGTNVNGNAGLANSKGIFFLFDATANTIGGATAAARNIISGNTQHGIHFGEPLKGGALNNVVQQNFIGTDVTGDNPIPNGRTPFFDTDAGIVIPANSRGDKIIQNRIAYNKGAGIRITNVSGSDTNSIEIEIVDNLIYANEGLGIDLGDKGITPNDALDTDDGPNRLQNFPVLTSAVGSSPVENHGAAKPETGGTGAPVTVNGTLNSTPNTTFTVHWYFTGDAQCVTNQQASRPLVTGKVPNVTTNSNGDAQFSFPLELPTGVNNGIVNCTATDSLGNTSEFSACLPVGSGAPSPTPGPSPSPSPSPSASPSPSPSPSPTASPSPSPGCSNLTVSPNQAIPDNNTAGVNIPIVVSGLSGTISDLNVKLNRVTHGWVGDLKFTLTSPDGTKSSVFIDRPGVPATTFGCSQANYTNTVLDDEAGAPIENVCTGGMTGNFTPNNPLSVFDGLNPNGTWTLNVSDLAGGITGTVQTVSLSICTNASKTIQYSLSSYSTGEANNAQITVKRSGDTSAGATVDYKTQDTDTFTVNCSDKHGNAFGRCDFATVVGTMTFAAGETSKSFTVPIVNDGYAEGNETFSVVLSNATGATLGAQSTATVTINDNETVDQPNPILQTNAAGVSFFVRQQYLDFLGREPEPGEPWSTILNGCSDQFNTDPASPAAGCDRINVSGSFFGSPEYKTKGFYVIDMYRVAFNRLPTYVEFSTDLASISGTTAAEVFAKRAAYASNFINRTEFSGIYGTMTNTQFVNGLMSGATNQGGRGQNYNLTSIRTPNPANPDDATDPNKVVLTINDLINGLTGATLTRGQVLRAIVQSDEISLQKEAVNAFVASQYYGYLRRAPDAGGFNSWVNHLINNPNDFRTMVHGFLDSIEYRLRFGSV